MLGPRPPGRRRGRDRAARSRGRESSAFGHDGPGVPECAAVVIAFARAASSESADALVLGVPFDTDASFGSGARRGPEAVFDCLHRQVELYERFSATEPALDFAIALEMLPAAGSATTEAMVAQLAERVARLEAFGVVVGGTHSVTIGVLRALARRFSPAEVTVVQLDAHLDLRDDDSDYSAGEPNRLAHACVMRRVHEQGFATLAIGARTYARSERDYAIAHRLPVFEWGRGDEPSVEQVLAAIPTEQVYLTIDVDGFDPSVMPATGTPVPDGISWRFGTDLVRRIGVHKTIVGADVVEVAPDGISGLTEYAAAQLCYELLAFKLLKTHERLALEPASPFVSTPSRTAPRRS